MIYESIYNFYIYDRSKRLTSPNGEIMNSYGTFYVKFEYRPYVFGGYAVLESNVDRYAQDVTKAAKSFRGGNGVAQIANSLS